HHPRTAPLPPVSSARGAGLPRSAGEQPLHLFARSHRRSLARLLSRGARGNARRRSHHRDLRILLDPLQFQNGRNRSKGLAAWFIPRAILREPAHEAFAPLKLAPGDELIGLVSLFDRARTAN